MIISQWETDNFGDCLNDLVWPNYIKNINNIHKDAYLFGIGSLLNHRLPVGVDKYFLGTGFGHGDVPNVDKTFKFVWVRGPRTANLIKQLSDRDVSFISDGALLLADMFQGGVAKIHETSFIPHKSAVNSFVWPHLMKICDRIGVNLINITDDRHKIINDIRASKKVISEALHGAIVSDAFGVPWLPVARRGIFDFKWFDYCESVNLNYKPVDLPYRTTFFDFTHSTGLKNSAKKIIGPLSLMLLERRLNALSKFGSYMFADRVVVTDKIKNMAKMAVGLESNIY
ncbi:hypothetical protein GCM10022279_01750 [Comamonas faecalis]|uniref:Polysaccharide pyruvyl transferase domain-containing protein n=1 Tax=Comamonas faecalis TaxID=1387849 RepID=A0ABP7QGN0_9BURK